MEKIFKWSKEKNQKLIKERGISFEAIVSQIEAGGVLAIVPGRGKFSHQKQFIVESNNYVYIIPFVEDSEHVFLKTVIPSRQLTKQLLIEDKSNEKISTR